MKENNKIWILIVIIFVGMVFAYTYSKNPTNDKIQQQNDAYPMY